MHACVLLVHECVVGACGRNLANSSSTKPCVCVALCCCAAGLLLNSAYSTSARKQRNPSNAFIAGIMCRYTYIFGCMYTVRYTLSCVLPPSVVVARSAHNKHTRHACTGDIRTHKFQIRCPSFSVPSPRVARTSSFSLSHRHFTSSCVCVVCVCGDALLTKLYTIGHSPAIFARLFVLYGYSVVF